jgi:anti-anti-sigma factor
VESPLQVEVVDHGDCGVVTIRGEVDMDSAAILQKYLEEAAHSYRFLIVDLSEVAFFAAVGLRCLEQADAILNRRGQTLSLVTDDNSLLTKVLQATHLEHRWPVHADVATALGATATSAPHDLAAG